MTRRPRLMMVPLADINTDFLGRGDPRLDPPNLEELMKSTEKLAHILPAGLIEPVILRSRGQGRYDVVAGRRRIAALMMRWGPQLQRGRTKRVPAIVYDHLTEGELRSVEFEENEVRAPVPPTQRIDQLRGLLDEGVRRPKPKPRKQNKRNMLDLIGHLEAHRRGRG